MDMFNNWNFSYWLSWAGMSRLQHTTVWGGKFSFFTFHCKSDSDIHHLSPRFTVVIQIILLLVFGRYKYQTVAHFFLSVLSILLSHILFFSHLVS